MFEITSTLRTCSSRKDLVQQYRRTQKCVYLSHWRILILLVYTKTYDTVDDRTGVWVPFVVRHVTFFFSLAGLMVFLPIFSCTPCSVVGRKQLWGLSITHILTAWAMNFGLKNGSGLNGTQPLGHLRRATACASCSSLDWPPVRKVGWGVPPANGVRMWNVTRWCSTVSYGGFVHYRLYHNLYNVSRIYDDFNMS